LDYTLRTIIPMPYRPLTKADILRALNRLGELAQTKGLTLEVALYGGAVFTVVYGSRDSTKDVDAIVRPSCPPDSSPAGCPRAGVAGDWSMMMFGSFSHGGRKAATRSMRSGMACGFRPHCLLSAGMKVNPARPLPGYAGDQDDIAFLVSKMGLKTFGRLRQSTIDSSHTTKSPKVIRRRSKP